jgi:murein DD-endopeptidase MepM/ murein hydrolase activator NlpD
MILSKKLLFFNTPSLYILLVLFVVCAHLPIKAATGDTLVSSISSSIKKKSLIQSMTREQLSSLVDYLFELDSIPQDLITEINIATANFNNEENKTHNNLLTSNSSFPSADLYVSWEINNLFPEKDLLKLKGDTSVTLVLKEKEHNPYFQPYNGKVTSNFGWRDSAQHNGIDINLNKGDKVASAFDGMVRIAKSYGGFGKVVIIRHYNGLETVYAHLSKIKVKPGQVITAGQIIGLGGSTGHSTGSHLHFEVRFKGVPINPKYLISFDEQKLLCDKLTIKKTKWGLAAYPANIKFYTVEKGDTVFEIAKHFGTTTSSIKTKNDLKSTRARLKVGQVINVIE